MALLLQLLSHHLPPIAIPLEDVRSSSQVWWTERFLTSKEAIPTLVRQSSCSSAKWSTQPISCGIWTKWVTSDHASTNSHQNAGLKARGSEWSRIAAIHVSSGSFRETGSSTGYIQVNVSISNAPLCTTGLTLSRGHTKGQPINTGGLTMSRMMKLRESTISF